MSFPSQASLRSYSAEYTTFTTIHLEHTSKEFHALLMSNMGIERSLFSKRFKGVQNVLFLENKLKVVVLRKELKN
jgi:hypothetical protein